VARMPFRKRHDAHRVERAERASQLRKDRPASTDRKRVRALVAISRYADLVAHEARLLLSCNRATAAMDDMRVALDSLASARRALQTCNRRDPCSR